MRRAISITAVILYTTTAAAGEIVWRSPVAGVLPHISNSSTPPEPEEPAFGIHYEPIRVAAGSVVNVIPSGAVTGYSFALRQPLPPGLTLDPNTGKIAGLAAVAGNYSTTIRAQKDGAYSDLVFTINIS